MSKHSKEPWRVGTVEKWHIFVPHPEGPAGPACGERVLLRFNEHFPYEEDARRIVACVNACAGIPTDELEQQAPARFDCDCGAKGIACVHLAVWLKQRADARQAPAQYVPRSQLDEATTANAVLVDALQALLAMSDRGPCPKKLDEALTWRQNDELAHSKALAALASAPARARLMLGVVEAARAVDACFADPDVCAPPPETKGGRLLATLHEEIAALDAPAPEKAKETP